MHPVHTLSNYFPNVHSNIILDLPSDFSLQVFQTKYCMHSISRFFMTFRNNLFFYGEQFLAPGQTPNWHTTTCRLYTTGYSIHSQLTPIFGGRLLHPQPEDAPYRGDRNPHKMAAPRRQLHAFTEKEFVQFMKIWNSLHRSHFILRAGRINKENTVC
jgi:hypothetical protein